MQSDWGQRHVDSLVGTCASFRAHAYVNVTSTPDANMKTRNCIIPCLPLFSLVDLNKAAKCMYMCKLGYVEAGFKIQTAGQQWLAMHNASQSTGGVGIFSYNSACRCSGPSAPWEQSAHNMKGQYEQYQAGLVFPSLGSAVERLKGPELKKGWLLFLLSLSSMTPFAATALPQRQTELLIIPHSVREHTITDHFR